VSADTPPPPALEFADPRVLLDKYGLRAKKSWGQNFLISHRVYDAIVRTAVRAPDDFVVEIGGGLGTLTARLAQAASQGRVVVVERERDMVDVLRGELGQLTNVEIAEQNALELHYDALARRAGKPLAVVGNLPYQIASRLIFGMIDARATCARMVIMLQKEMADRVLAAPDTDAYGALGVMVQTYCDARSVIKAPSAAFYPAPRVDSTVIELTPLPGAQTRVPISDEKQYSALVHAAFGQRRKTLKNAMRSRWDDEAIVAGLAAAEIDGIRRGETLSVAEFARLSNLLAPVRPT
jgi:16S rRNA (adenine1518-N6/adenine1519-N6)-dimethyltransferase